MCMPVGFCCRAEARLRGRELPLGTVVAVTIPWGREEAAEERQEKDQIHVHGRKGG